MKNTMKKYVFFKHNFCVEPDVPREPPYISETARNGLTTCWVWQILLSQSDDVVFYSSVFQYKFVFQDLVWVHVSESLFLFLISLLE